MNRSEWEDIGEMLDIDSESTLLESFNLEGMILTLGGEGSIYFDNDGSYYIETAANISLNSGDFVGVGDAFWACFIHHTLHNTSWQVTLQKANRYAGWVAEQKGGIPDPDEELIKSIV